MAPRKASGKGGDDGNGHRKRSVSLELSDEEPVKKTRKLATSVKQPSSLSRDQAPVKPSRHGRYYLADGNLVLLVDDVLYNIHRYFFKQYSAHFATMFSLPAPSGQQAEGLTDNNPIHLTGITTTQDLDRLLSIFYPVEISKFEMQTVEDWTSVYSLALRWQFEGVAKIASQRLFEVTTPIDKIVLGRLYPELEDWLRDALLSICTRGESLSLEEGRMLSRDDLILMASMRDKFRNRDMSRTSSSAEARMAQQIETTFGLTPQPLPKRRKALPYDDLDAFM